MNAEQPRDALVTHGLMIRQIPEKVVSTLDVRHRDSYPDAKVVERPNRFGGTYRCLVHERVPENAGWWMCQRSPSHTGAGTQWSAKDHNVAPTLEESVQLFLDSLEKEGEG